MKVFLYIIRSLAREYLRNCQKQILQVTFIVYNTSYAKADWCTFKISRLKSGWYVGFLFVEPWADLATSHEQLEWRCLSTLPCMCWTPRDCTSATSDGRKALIAMAGSPKTLQNLQRIWNLAVAQYISPVVEAYIYPSSFQSWGGKGKKMGYFSQNPAWLQTNAGWKREEEI